MRRLTWTPLSTRGGPYFFSHLHSFHLILESKIFSFQRRSSDALASVLERRYNAARTVR